MRGYPFHFNQRSSTQPAHYVAALTETDTGDGQKVRSQETGGRILPSRSAARTIAIIRLNKNTAPNFTIPDRYRLYGQWNKINKRQQTSKHNKPKDRQS